MVRREWLRGSVSGPVVLALFLALTTMAAMATTAGRAASSATPSPSSAPVQGGAQPDTSAVMAALGADGHFRVMLRNLGPQPAPINRIHTWAVQVSTPQGRPVSDAAVVFDGGMPDHGHGFPTQPQLTAQRKPGLFHIEGVKFNMGGLWRFEFRIRAGDVSDVVRFDLQLEN